MGPCQYKRGRKEVQRHVYSGRVTLDNPGGISVDMG